MRLNKLVLRGGLSPRFEHQRRGADQSGRTRLPVWYPEWRCQRQITALQPKVLTFDEGNHIRDRFTSSADCNVEGNYDFSIHGCFWHGHDCPRGSRQPKTNIEYWSAKIARNRLRDEENAKALARANCVVWECELKDMDKLETKVISFLGLDDK